MKTKNIWFATLLVLPLYGDLSIGQMDTMVEKIKAKREGATKGKHIDFISPFVMIQKEKGKAVIADPKNTEIVFSLGAIINDKAFINKVWLKSGDQLQGYTLDEIGEKSVRLVQDERKIEIFLKKSKPILQLNEGKK